MSSYIEGAQYGFSKIVPQVAYGVKQRYIESLNAFENEILDLDSKLVPLMSSHTMSGKVAANMPLTKTGNKEAQDASDKDNGRPELDSNEKKDSTIAKEASQ